MIQLFVPCFIPFPLGTTIHGSADNTALPDPLLGSTDFQGTKILLNKTIGDDISLTYNENQSNIRMHKAYDLLDDVLYEYSLFQLDMTGSDIPYYIPISVKRYDSNMPYTFLFVRGLLLALDAIKGARDYSIISVTTLMKSFSGDAITFVDSEFSIELPQLIENILSELGTYAFYDCSSSDVTLKYMFEEIGGSYTQLLAYDSPRDFISYCACNSDNFIPRAVMERNIDQCVNGFYSPFAVEAQNKLKERMGVLIPLDNKQPLFYQFRVQSILNELYQAPFTDVSMIVEQSGSRDVHVQKLFGIQPIYPSNIWTRLSPELSIATYLHDGIIHYNQHNVNRIDTLVFAKNWIDDLHIDVYMENGECHNYYLNLALYHLYSPSIVRLHQRTIM